MNKVDHGYTERHEFFWDYYGKECGEVNYTPNGYNVVCCTFKNAKEEEEMEGLLTKLIDNFDFATNVEGDVTMLRGFLKDVKEEGGSLISCLCGRKAVRPTRYDWKLEVLPFCFKCKPANFETALVERRAFLKEELNIKSMEIQRISTNICHAVEIVDLVWLEKNMSRMKIIIKYIDELMEKNIDITPRYS